MIKKLLLLFTITLSTTHAGENPIFGYTHMLPSPFTLPAGRLVIGTHVSYGVTDFLTVGTNVFRDLYKIYNADAKLALFDYEQFAFAVTGGYESYKLRDVDPSNPDISVTSWLPGAVASFELLPRFALFLGGNLNYSSLKSNTPGVEASALVIGSRGNAELSWGYSGEDKKRRGFGNVISGGVSYDFTYEMYGFGLSHHWPGLQIGAHYFPSATRYKVLPIISGGAVVDI